MQSSKIISIINHKGGVGKTTTAVNLAEALTREGLRVLVVDMDPQCNSTEILLPGAELKRTLFDLLNPEETAVQPHHCIYTTQIEGLDCLPNSADSTFLEPELIKLGPSGFQRLRKQLTAYALANYQLTLIDNPPNLGTFVASSLFASDYVIIPYDAGSSGSLRGFSKALDFIAEIRQNGNPQLRFLRGLLTRVDRRTSVWRMISEEKQEKLGGEPVFQTVIPMNTDFQRAEFLDKTIFQVRPGAPGARAYQQLAQELLQII